ncbi:hypothetical protein [Streptomyces avermitilis]|uniref:hypothetical protein n=1 Tax=Streptomyces avermitilis TaxID=33903 RepID=UPI00371B9BC7
MHIVLDDTAMTAADQGNVPASRLIHCAHAESGWFLYAPACASVEADRGVCLFGALTFVAAAGGSQLRMLRNAEV